jgi:hypothetical protein
VVHLLACDTAISLGPTLVAHHAKAFWGYVAPFTFLGTRDHPNPANDPESAPFLEMALQVDLGLLRGDDRATIFAQVSQSFAKAYNKLSADGQQRLFENFNALRCIEGGATYQPSSPGP